MTEDLHCEGKLETKCGATRQIRLPWPPPWEWRVPIPFDGFTVKFDGNLTYDKPTGKYRRYILMSKHILDDGQRVANYKEFEDVAL